MRKQWEWLAGRILGWLGRPSGNSYRDWVTSVDYVYDPD